MTRLFALLVAGLAAAREPEATRLASFSPAATRILVDLGRADRLAAATRWCELPEGSPAARSCDAFEPELEALVRLRPDAVVLPRLANPLLAERVRSAGLRVVLLSPESPESPASDILALGDLTGSSARARELVAARRILAPPGKRRVLIVWNGVCAGPESYLSWVIRSAGAEPAPRSGAWPEWDSEKVTITNPDLVLYLESSAEAGSGRSSRRINEWRSSPGLRSTTCSSKGYIFEIKPGSDWLPASGLPRAARILADLLEKNQ